MIRQRRILAVLLSLSLGIGVFHVEAGRIYAMEAVEDRIEEAMKESNPEQYEMNIILSDLGIRNWRYPSYAFDEADNPVDEPLGKYSPEELQKYTDRELEVEIDYGYGRLWETTHEDFLQVIRIYEAGEIQSFSRTSWVVGFVDSHSGRLRYPLYPQGR